MSKEINLTECVDAKVWAEEFCRICVNDLRVTIDEDLMLTWFANAICAGQDSVKTKKVEVWVFDDLLEEGYRFNNWDCTQHCFIPKQFASCASEAINVLDKIFEYVPKYTSDSVSGKSVQICNELVLVKEL